MIAGSKKRFSHNKKSKIPAGRILYRGQTPTQSQSAMRSDSNQALLIDESGNASSERLLIVATYVPRNGRPRFRKTAEQFPSRKTGRMEVKYSNTTAEERESIFYDLDEQDFEIRDSSNYILPPNVTSFGLHRFGHNLSYPESRYLYYLETIIKNAMDAHPGAIDIIMDSPPLNITDEIMRLCLLLIEEGYKIDWYTISPSRTITELQVHDFITGIDSDIVSDNIELNGNLSKTHKMKSTIDGLVKRKR